MTSVDHASSVWKQLPLEPSANSIRLLQIHPNATGELECSMGRECLDDEPSYYAVSYCWGPHSTGHAVRCNGQVITVQDSLYRALHQLRQHGYEKVWADAICIDQANNREKSQQVAMMGRIYEQAQATLVWLGSPKQPDDRYAIDLVRLFEHVLEAHGNTPNMVGPLHLEPQKVAQLGLPAWNDDYDPALEPLYELLTCSWGGRAWVVQEVLLAREVRVFYGSQVGTLGLFLGAIVWLRHLSAWSLISERPPIGLYERLPAMDVLRRSFQVVINPNAHDPDIFLTTLIANHFASQCRDPRDRVYSLLGIVDAFVKSVGGSFFLQPDYSQPVEAVYSDFMRELLVNSRNLDIVVFLRGPASEYGSSLPSWVIDWTGALHSPILLVSSYTFSATQNSIKVAEIEGRMLRLNCHHFDMIAEISEGDMAQDMRKLSEADYTSRADVDLDWLMRWTPIMESFLKVCSPGGVYITGEACQSAFICTFHMTDQIHNDGEFRVLMMQGLVAVRNEIPQMRLPLTKSSRAELLRSEEWALLQSMLIQRCGLRELKEWFERPMRMARTRRGYYCTVPVQAEQGDEIILCAGGRTPFVCRPHDPPSTRYKLLGGCYVRGIMSGEAWNPDDAKDRWFE